MSELVVIRSCTIYQICKSLSYGQLIDSGKVWFIFEMKYFFSSFDLFISYFDGDYNFRKDPNYFHWILSAFLFRWFRILISNFAGFFVIPSWLNELTISSSVKISTSFFSFKFCFGFHPNLKMKVFIASGSYYFLNVRSDEVGSLFASFLPCWFCIRGKWRNFGTVAPKTLYK